MISTVILTKNKADHLKELLPSLNWADETIIIDDNSTDATRKVAKKFHANVLKRNLNNDYAAQRNFGLTKAKNNWVLFIDTDERITPRLKQEILKEIKLDQYSGFYINRLDLFLGRVLNHGEIGHTRLLRLAKKSAGKWARPVHEAWKVKGKTKTLNHPLIHAPHPTITSFLEKINNYTSIEADYRRSHNENFSLLQLLLYPPVKFIHNYIFRLGFLDGFPGLVMTFMMSLHSLIVRIKVYENSL